ncbi:NAD(P)H-dependent oxidoreductase [Necropsobacter massiliensis]|uniref:NAD(P)H-dependent oxidoreductase n=1 Tax=Necropsobacter massiliensis TaxID=1400001 RepID=UPI000509441E|nr:NAD(P)H-dependent oxidoreductase [Necropsobacter massiliensis]
MKNLLIISGHPNLSQSVANTVILGELAQALPQAQIRKLDALYPNYRIDVAAEQQALLAAEVIVWQFPFYWYSMPALMKKWLDDVFVHGFAHGSGAKLAGKKLLISFTTGAPHEVYQKDGAFKHTVADFLAAFEMTAALCGLEFIKPMYLNGVSYVGRNEQAIARQQTEAKTYAQALIETIKNL